MNKIIKQKIITLLNPFKKSKETITPTETEKTKKKMSLKAEHTAGSVIISGVATWLMFRYLLNPLHQMIYQTNFRFWWYLIIFGFLTATTMNMMAVQEAVMKAAYPKK